jgi:hypothetical protein
MAAEIQIGLGADEVVHSHGHGLSLTVDGRISASVAASARFVSLVFIRVSGRIA